MVLPSSGAISVNDFATEYEIGTGSPIGFDRIKTISTNWSGTSMGMDQLYSLDRDDFVGKSALNISVVPVNGLGTFSSFANRQTLTFRVAVGLSATTNGNIVNTGNLTAQGVAIYTWNGVLYARGGAGTSNGGNSEVSFTIPNDWTTDQIRIVVVTFCSKYVDDDLLNQNIFGSNLLFVDGILRGQSRSTSYPNPTQSFVGGKTSVVNTVGYGVRTRMTNNELSYGAPTAIKSAQVWYDHPGYLPGYTEDGVSNGDYFIYENSNVYHVITDRGSGAIFGIYDIGPNTRPDVRYLMVGGGGGAGGQGADGGGGGGGILFDDTGVTLASGTYPVTIGAPAFRANGGNTTFNGYTALGGGEGGTTKKSIPGGNGGAGGGAARGTIAGTGSQGGDGGDSDANLGGGGGGGGASGQDGGVPTDENTGGVGGDGTQYPWGHIGGTATYYGGGGLAASKNLNNGDLAAAGGGGGYRQDGFDIYGGGAYGDGGVDGGIGHITIRLPWTLPTS